MGSQTDLDQGGTNRQTQDTYLGPSIGWVRSAVSVILPITVGGITIVQSGNSLVTVNFNGSVTIQLPLSKGNPAGAGAVPGGYVQTPITVVDIGGFATAHPITILPAGTETIDGITAASGGIKLQSSYGAYVLQPDTINGGWILTQ